MVQSRTRTRHGSMGVPYKSVMGKLQRSSPSITESLDELVVNKVLTELFPIGDIVPKDFDRSRDPIIFEPVIVSEIRGGFAGSKSRRTGPDGITKSMWMNTPTVVQNVLRLLFNKCLAEGCISEKWKYAMLVLISKQPGSGLLKSRPICLLNDVAKAFEWVLVNRIWHHLSEVTGKRLSKAQYRFRKGLSTTDALMYMDTYVRQGLVERHTWWLESRHP